MESPDLEPSLDEFPDFCLSDGRRVRIRPSRAADAVGVAEAMRTASAATLRNRFLVAFRGVPESELRTRLDVRSPDEFCLVAILGERVIGGARFVRLGDPVAAEIAVTVHDDFQKQGLGTALVQHLIPIARQRNIRRLVGESLNDNQAVVSLLSRFGPLRVSRTEPGVRHLELDFQDLL